MLRVACPACRELLQFAEAKSGAVAACPHCGKRLRLPAAPVPSAEEAVREKPARRGRRSDAADGREHRNEENQDRDDDDTEPRPRQRKRKLNDFGRLGVDRKGLSYGDSFLRWKEVESVSIEKGYIYVGKKGKWLNWCNIAAAKVPNLHVFLALVDEIKGVKGL